jgi:Cullin binding
VQSCSCYLQEPESQDIYTALYRFAFFSAHAPQRKFLHKSDAIPLWQAILHGRFRRLHDWCRFVCESDVEIISEDTWTQARPGVAYISGRVASTRQAWQRCSSCRH